MFFGLVETLKKRAPICANKIARQGGTILKNQRCGPSLILKETE
jgi:hypothetical protein